MKDTYKNGMTMSSLLLMGFTVSLVIFETAILTLGVVKGFLGPTVFTYAIVGSALVVLVAVLTVNYFVWHKIESRLDDLTDVCRDFVGGDRSVRAGVIGTDAFAILSMSLNALLDSYHFASDGSSKPPQQALHCTQCNIPYEEGDAFCKKCGLALTALRAKTELAMSIMTCPKCSAAAAKDATFCMRCGSAISLPGGTNTTILVNAPPKRTTPESMIASSTQAETQQVMTSTHTCPACHAKVLSGPGDKFCGYCGYMLA